MPSKTPLNVNFFMSSGRVFVERRLTSATTTTTRTTATHASRRSPHDHNNIISSEIPGGRTGARRHEGQPNRQCVQFAILVCRDEKKTYRTTM